MNITRRQAARLIAAAPIGLPAASALMQPEKRTLSRFATCVAASETTSSPEERARLETALGKIEESLKAIREFKLPLDTAPALRFAAIKSPRS
jgi:hypothetical protein